MLMIAITSHFIDANFVLHEDLLDFQHVPERHTGKNLAAHIHKILHKFEIHTKLYCITTDSASNNGKMMKELAILFRQQDSITWDGPAHHIPCFAHIVNLAVKKFLKNLKIMSLSEEHEWVSNPRPVAGSDGNAQEEDDSEEDEVMMIDEDKDEESEVYKAVTTNDFPSTLKKLRMISKAANFPQSRIIAFEQFCIASQIKPLRPIRDHDIRWNATFHMLERAVYLRGAIDSWTRSKPEFINLILGDREWEMAQFLVHFLRPFQVVSTVIQETANPSLHETWIKYEEMFDCLDTTKNAFNALTIVPPWLKQAQAAVEAMWAKLRKYYDASGRPNAFVDATLLHPALKVGFMKKSKYDEELIERYKRQAGKLQYAKNM
jgi:hypothetical protein